MSKVLKRVLRYWGPAIIWGILIFSGSSVTTPQISTVYWQDFAVHKFFHIVEYSILAVFFYRALLSENMTKKTAVVYAIMMAFLYGATDEFHQRFTPHRTPYFRDVIIDTIGASVGVLIIWKLLPKMPKKLLDWARKLDLL